MFLKNLRFALRNLWRDKFYTLINGIGLTVGMTITLLIFLWVNDELTFDQFHTKKDRIYRVLTEWSFGGERELTETTPAPLGIDAKEQISEIETFVRMGQVWDPIFKYGDQLYNIDHAYLVDKGFFELFDFPFHSGSKQTAFNQPNNAIISVDLAKRIYGTTDVIGQPILVPDKMELVISGVIENTPSNSHLQLDLLFPFEENMDQFFGEGATHWGSYNFNSYALLRPGIDKQLVDKKLSDLIPEREGISEEDRAIFKLQPLTDIHLNSNIEYSDVPQGDTGTIRLISIIGILILLIACINYINLTTARATHRAKSTSVRKIVGASRRSLIAQYLSESTILTTIAAFFAVFIAQSSLGLFEELSGKHFSINQLLSIETLIILLGVVVITSILTGIQPAIQLSAFSPLEAIKGDTAITSASGTSFRKLLVIGQFTCSGALIICTLVVLVQINFVRKTKLGYERNHIFSFYVPDADPLIMKTELLNQVGISEVALGSNSIVSLGSQFGGFDYEGKLPDTKTKTWAMNAGENFSDFFDLEIQQGRWFLPGNHDSTSFILNESAVAKFGLDNPIGKWMDYNGVKGTIVGVIKDFHFQSLHRPIEQLVFSQRPSRLFRIYVKTKGGQAATAIASAEKVFKKYEPNALFDYRFLDESYNNLYKTEIRSGNLLACFAGLAILLSCLGIFGLAAYTAERRQKEISVRKVLGATISNIVILLAKDIIKLVLIALLIAVPIAWYFMQEWLQNFAYHIDMPWWVFGLTMILAVTIATTTVGFQAVKAALTNPIKSLKQE